MRGSTSSPQIAKSKQIIPTRMTFVDIAGLVKGASKGEGLGNQFLANIREVDAIAHVLRCFEDGDVIHVDGRVDPVADAETIETELMLADLESLEKRPANLVRKVQGRRQGRGAAGTPAEGRAAVLEEGKPARIVKVDDEDRRAWRHAATADRQARALCLQCRGSGRPPTGNAMSDARRRHGRSAQGDGHVVISAQIEEEIASSTTTRPAMFLSEMGLEEAGLDRLIRARLRTA